MGSCNVLATGTSLLVENIRSCGEEREVYLESPTFTTAVYQDFMSLFVRWWRLGLKWDGTYFTPGNTRYAKETATLVSSRLEVTFSII